jgi:hypothetical protein
LLFEPKPDAEIPDPLFGIKVRVEHSDCACPVTIEPVHPEVTEELAERL